MYTLNFLNNYFIAILEAAIIYFSAIPTASSLPQLVQQQLLTCVITLV
jgi:hypothetical protein